MARNLTTKLNNLKINTNMDNLYENKNLANGSVRANNIMHATAVKSNNYNPLLSNNNLNGNNNPSSNKYYGLENDKNKQTAPRSSSKGHLSNNGGNNKILHNLIGSSKPKELENEIKYHPETFSPKTTKSNFINSKANHSANSINKFMPLSTRNNNNVNTNSFVNNNNEVNQVKREKANSSNLITNYNNNTNNNSNPSSSSTETNPNNMEMVNVMTLLGAQNNTPITLKNLTASIPNYDNSKFSVKSMSVIKAYAANTHQGIIRSYNEDRVSIILNIIKPSTFKGDTWPKCSFFGIYDGHGGSSCADFLRDSLHQYIIKDSNFPYNIKEAIRKGFENAEKEFLNTYALNKNGEVIDRSGSCAVVTLIVDNTCYVANVGDSRAIMSMNEGIDINVLSNDHKPNEPGEKKRIIESGGKVYQTQTPAKNFNISLNNTGINANQILVGPHRVFPGRLSVSRTLGDVEAKLVKLGGLPNVIIPTPEIQSFEIKSNMDFIIMGCDGIFDQLSNEEVINCVWLTTKESIKCQNIHLQSGTAIDMIIKSSLVRRTLDNVTSVMIAFSNFEKVFKPEEEKERYVPVHTQPDKKPRFSTGALNENIISNQAKTPKNKIDYFSGSEEAKKAISYTQGKLDAYTSHFNSNGSLSGINLEIYKNGLVDNQTRKSYIQKKIVSLDMSSNKKGVNFITKSDKDLQTKKRLDYSEDLDKDKHHHLLTHGNLPLTTKHSHLKLKDLNFVKKYPK